MRRRSVEPPPIVVDGIAHRPPAEQDPGIVGFSRLTRGKLGSRLFLLFFVLVYVVIVGDLLYSLTHP